MDFLEFVFTFCFFSFGCFESAFLGGRAPGIMAAPFPSSFFTAFFICLLLRGAMLVQFRSVSFDI